MKNKTKAILLFVFWIFLFITFMHRLGGAPNFGWTVFNILVSTLSATIAVAFAAKKVFGWSRY